MQNRLVVPEDKLLTRQRSISETINNQLKTISQILHTRHRSTVNFAVNPYHCWFDCLHLARQETISLTRSKNTSPFADSLLALSPAPF